MKIVIDGFGGDNAPDEVLKGAALAVKELGIDIAITGDEKILMERMKALDISDSHLELVHHHGGRSQVGHQGEFRHFNGQGAVLPR